LQGFYSLFFIKYFIMGYRVRVKIAALLLLLFTMCQVTVAFAHPVGSKSKPNISLSSHSQRLASTTSTNSNRNAQKQAHEQAAGVNQHLPDAATNDSDCCGIGCSSFMSISSQLGSMPITSKKAILDNYWFILPAKQADNLYRPPIIS
jgi:hypothetical protein